MTTCPSCSGIMSSPMLGRRTGLWLSTCRSCGQTIQSQQPPSHAAVANHSAMFQQDAPEFLSQGTMRSFDRTAVAGTVRKAILSRRELQRANQADGKLKQSGD